MTDREISWERGRDKYTDRDTYIQAGREVETDIHMDRHASRERGRDRYTDGQPCQQGERERQIYRWTAMPAGREGETDIQQMDRHASRERGATNKCI
jgi:hypothetical protein